MIQIGWTHYWIRGHRGRIRDDRNHWLDRFQSHSPSFEWFPTPVHATAPNTPDSGLAPLHDRIRPSNAALPNISGNYGRSLERICSYDKCVARLFGDPEIFAKPKTILDESPPISSPTTTQFQMNLKQLDLARPMNWVCHRPNLLKLFRLRRIRCPVSVNTNT